MITEDVVEIAARHEAGHAVMRWLCCLPATTVIVSQDGSGFCHGTGRRIWLVDKIRILLAGPAAEIDMSGSSVLDWERSSFVDFDLVRKNMDEVALKSEFDHVCDLLWPHAELIDDIAEHLCRKGAISPRVVAALCREYARRTKVQT